MRKLSNIISKLPICFYAWSPPALLSAGHKVLTYVDCWVCVCVWRLPKYWPPAPLSTQRVCPPPNQKQGCTYSPGDGGSIFWKTPDIELASYSIISLRCRCSGQTLCCVSSWAASWTTPSSHPAGISGTLQGLYSIHTVHWVSVSTATKRNIT